jgi:peroxiredoxin
MKRGNWIGSKATICFAFSLAVGCSPLSATKSPRPGAETSESVPSSELELSPPDFQLSTLSGDTVSLSEHLGKQVILLDFWATYCAPCLVAMPHLNDLHRKYESQGFVVLGVSVDERESLDEVRSIVQKLKVAFPILLDQDAEVLALYNENSSAPYSVLIDRRGRIVKKKEGFDVAALEELEGDIVQALSAGKE